MSQEQNFFWPEGVPALPTDAPNIESTYWMVNVKQQRINNLSTNMKVIEEYLKVKVTSRDWHAVGDAANDIREIEAELVGLNT